MGLSTSSQATMFPPRVFIICTSLPLMVVAQYQAQVKPFVHHQLSHHGPAPAYSQPAPARGYGHPATAAPSYGPPAPPVHHVHGPGVVRFHKNEDHCDLDYVEKTEEVCVPSFKTDCDKESVPGGKVIKHHDQCYDVTKTVCTETHGPGVVRVHKNEDHCDLDYVEKIEDGGEVKIDKCSVEVEDKACSEVILQLPRQRCPSKVVTPY